MKHTIRVEWTRWHWNQRGFLLILLALYLSGCGALIDRMTATETHPPAPLQKFTPQITLTSGWYATIGSGEGDRQLGLKPTVQEDVVYAAAMDGQVKAYHAETGKRLWAVDLGEPLSAGPGVGQGLIVLGTREGEVIALADQDGTEQWRAQVTSEVQAAPLVGEERIVVTALDGSMTGLDLAGETQWVLPNDMPVLNLQGVSSPVLRGNQVIQGAPNGQMLVLDIRNGRLLWKANIALPTGRSALQRLVDVDTDPLIHQGILYIATYQGGIVALSGHSGAVLWRQPFSSYRNLAADADNLYAVNAIGEVWAFDLQTGDPRWQQTTLLKNRGLSDPVILDGWLVVGDQMGYVHVLSTADGSLAARKRVGRSAIRRGILNANGVLYVQDAAGDVHMIRVGKK